MTQQQIQEYRACVISAIEHGAAKVIIPPLTDKEIRRITDAGKIEAQKQKRLEYLAMGLTCKGKIRRHSREKLDGLTDEQKRQRLLMQKKAWRQRKKMALCPSTPQTES